MSRTLTILSTALLVPFLTAAAAQAQGMSGSQMTDSQMADSQMMDSEPMESSRRHHVTGMLGFQLFDLTDEFDDAGTDFNEEITFDGRYEYRFTPHWGIEGFATYSPAKADVFNDTAETDVDAWYTTGGVAYYVLPDAIVNPFVFGGLGAAILDISGGDTESYFAGNFGGGVELPVHPNLAVRGEVRNFIYSVDDLDPTSAAALGLSEDFDDVINDLQFSGGVTFRF